jgi:hypothetical protein
LEPNHQAPTQAGNAFAVELWSYNQDDDTAGSAAGSAAGNKQQGRCASADSAEKLLQCVQRQTIRYQEVLKWFQPSCSYTPLLHVPALTNRFAGEIRDVPE